MSFLKKFVMLGLLVMVSVWLHSSLALAQDKYPSRQIEMVIPWPAGGSTDISGRIFSNDLNKALKVPVVPVNKAGASGTVGATYVYKAKKDGYTLMCGSLGWLFGSITLEGIVYDPLKDFIAVTNMSSTPHGLFVKKDSPLKSLEDFIDRAKKNPRVMSVGTAGVASDAHFNLEILQKSAGMQIKHVPFKGVGEVPPAVLGGHVEAGVGVASAFLQFIKSGDLRCLAITGSVRIKEFDAPTFTERGLKGTFFNNWVGLFAQAGVAQDVLPTLAQASEKIVKSKEYVDAIEKTGSVVIFMTPAQFFSSIEEERKVADGIAIELGLKQGKK